jgi:uncharacterized protein
MESLMENNHSWWRFPHVWLVIAGPLVVVVASFVTFYLAAKSADLVLPTTPQGQSAADLGSEPGITMAPAMQARNHAATGVLPAADKNKKP